MKRAAGSVQGGGLYGLPAVSCNASDVLTFVLVIGCAVPLILWSFLIGREH